MKECSLAVDIGASGGNVSAGFLEKGKLKLVEVHRFSNNLIEKDNKFIWDIDKLFTEIKNGIAKCENLELLPNSIGINTWAVDFVLLDENGNLLTDAIAYRDPRTNGVMEEVFQILNKEYLYERTGIQFQKFNTIFQLYALKMTEPEILEKAKSFLMIPDYFNYLLTGNKVNEYTNVTTTQLVNAFTKDWDYDLIEKLGFNSEMFHEINQPKTIVGNLKSKYKSKFGFDMQVILPATHDTASAVVAIPEPDETIFLSSGTWSLIGVENDSPLCTESALHYNFTNEGGFDYRYRFLKNIMGLWMIQEVRRLCNNKYSFKELVNMAQETAEDFNSIVDVNDERFLNPPNMIKEIESYCRETNQVLPKNPGEIAKCIYDSLAESYRDSIKQIEKLMDKEYNTIHIIGGGAKNKMLNKLIAIISKKEVYAGPFEATALGNIIVQLIALGKINNLKESRELVKHSFQIDRFLADEIS